MYLRRCENGTWTTWVKFSMANHNHTFSGTPASHNHSIAALTTGGPSATTSNLSTTSHTHSIG
jgi:hypothetical protein